MTYMPFAARAYTFTRPIIKGEPTKATKILMDIYNFSKIEYYFRKEELLRRAGVKYYNSPGEFDSLWASAKWRNLTIRKNGKVYPGTELESYLKKYNLI